MTKQLEKVFNKINKALLISNLFFQITLRGSSGVNS